MCFLFLMRGRTVKNDCPLQWNVQQQDSVLRNIEHINVIHAAIILVTLSICYCGANFYWNEIEGTHRSNDIHFEWFGFLMGEPMMVS